MHSATKYLGGHGTAIGGVIVDGGKFDWAANAARSPASPSPTRATTASSTARAVGPAAYILKARVQLLRDLGPAIAPFNAFLLAQGLETLSLRMERHVAERASAVAEWLEKRDEVESVSYAGPAESARGTSGARSTCRAAPARSLVVRAAPAGSRPAGGSSTR